MAENLTLRSYFIVTYYIARIVKVRLSSSKKVNFICFNKSPLKIKKNAFLVMQENGFI